MKRMAVIAATVLAIVPVGEAIASRPVPKTVTACVVKGELTRGPYTYSVRKDTGEALAKVDLAPYEGKRIRVKGYLLPGDILVSKSIEVLEGACKD
jgi:hypothetical protein